MSKLIGRMAIEKATGKRVKIVADPPERGRELMVAFEPCPTCGDVNMDSRSLSELRLIKPVAGRS